MARSPHPTPGPHVYFSTRHLQREVKDQLNIMALALNQSVETVANAALKIGLNVLKQKIAKGEK